MTVYGLMEMHRFMNENELAILFHNNHFSVIYKSHGDIYDLCTDIRLVDDQPLLAWTRLQAVYALILIP